LLPVYIFSSSLLLSVSYTPSFCFSILLILFSGGGGGGGGAADDDWEERWH
jgi:hypothetical protein